MSIDAILREVLFVSMFIVVLMAIGQLSTKKKLLYNYLIGALNLEMALFLFANWNTLSDLSFKYPQLALIDLPVLYLGGPTIYYLFLYVDHKRLNKKTIIHLLPFIISLILMLPFYFKPDWQKGAHMQNAFFYGSLTLQDVLYELGLFSIVLYSLAITVKFRHMFRFKVFHSQPNFKALAFFLLTSILAAFCAAMVIFYREFIFFRLGAIIVSVPLFVFFILNYRDPDLLKTLVFLSADIKKYSPNPADTEKKISAIPIQFEARLKQAMVVDKIYLNKELSRFDLAQATEVSSNFLSLYLNDIRNTNFYSYINGYRIKEAIHLLQTTDLAIIEIIHLSGFSSKATFNRSFKEHTNVTPGEFRKRKSS